VVVVVEAVDLPRLDAALGSVLDQGGVDLTVLLAPVAGTAATTPGHDARVHVLPAQPTWQRAASAGAAAAAGDHLLFLRGCDLLAPGALARGAATLARSGSAVCSGRVDQAGEPEPWLARAQREAHALPRTCRSSDGPLDLTLAGTMIRRSAWAGRALADDEDWLLSVTVAALLADGGDLLVEPACTWFPDHGTRAYGATPSTLPGLETWQRRAAEVTAVVGDGPLAAGWRRLLAGAEVPRLLDDAERADDDQWRQLRDIARSVCADPRWGSGVPAAARVMLWLAGEDRRADLELVAAEVAALGDDLRTVRRGGAVLAEWPVTDLPVEVCELGADETALLTSVVRVGPAGPALEAGEREAVVLVAIDHVDLSDPTTRVVVHDAQGREVGATPIASAEAGRWPGRRFAAPVAVSVRVPGSRGARLRVTASVGALARTGEVLVPERAAPTPAPVVVDDLTVEDGALAVTASGDLSRLRLLGRGDVPVAVHVVRHATGARLDLAVEQFGERTWLPSGSYRLVDGSRNVSVTEGLRARLPESWQQPHHRVRAHLGPLGGVVLELGAPLADDEVGAYAQQRLQTAYLADAEPVDPDLFYFESYAGRTATDSPRAIFEELRRRRPDVRAYWGVADRSQRAPAGAVPVLLRSREWYAVLARAGVLVLNTDTEVWFRRRPGQRLLQTFHGYPSKAMGIGQWQAKDFRPSRIRELRARGVDTWTTILTPTPEMTRHYREQYDYDGPALEHGYPRDDDLVGPDASGRRDDARRRLGIGPDRTAVLYAPTWRDHLASRPRAAAMTDFLDVAEAARALGEDYVLLLRGHRFHVTQTLAAGGARVVDVTSYPEINDLILAADAAVLDYSSLRFDFALTGRPMVFLVPDLEEYARGSRQFLFPFEDSAPGPFVHDTAGVVQQLLDPTLAKRHADEIAAFNARYNPWQDGHAAARVVDALLAPA
jgi:CDP-glycerol glycerophosphotransferase (TagB/SpsB family)